MARIQYLPAQEKEQIQDFRNWIQKDPEATTRSAPKSPVIGLIENPTAVCQNTDTPGTSNEPNPGTSNESNPEAPKLTTSTATEGTSSAAGIGSGGAEGSRNPAV